MYENRKSKKKTDRIPGTICITNRHLAADLLRQIAIAIDAGADTILLREKDLPEEEYERLAKQVMALCEEKNALCVLHSFTGVARRLGCPRIHLTLEDFLAMTEEERADFQMIGVSVHSVDDAARCQELGASYITASHIFPTECKAGLAPRGLDFLRRVCRAVSIPVYALGGSQKSAFLTVWQPARQASA